MRLAEIATEAWRSVATGTSRALLLAAVTVVLFGSAAWWDTAAVADTQRDARGFVSAGASTYVLDAAGLIDPIACDQLSTVPGITAAGAFAAAGPGITPIATPQRTIPLYTISPGFHELVGAPPGGMVATDTVVDQYGLATHPLLNTTTGYYPVLGAYSFPDDGRDATLGYALLAPGASTSRYNQCWAKIDPPDVAKQALLYTALVAGTSSADKVTIGQLNPRLGVTASAQDDFRSRTSRWAPPITAIAGALLTFTAMRLRRLEHATSRHLGITRAELMLQGAFETLMWSFPALMLTAGGLIAWTASSHIGGDVTIFGMLALLAGWMGTLLGAIAGSALIREQQLMYYFKIR